MSIKRSLKSVAKAAFEATISQLPARTKASSQLILAYHNIVPEHSACHGDESLHLSHRAFCQQLKTIQNHADIVPLTELLNEPGAGVARVAITFDDAYLSSVRLGLHECESRRIPATVFVSPMLLGTTPPWDYLSARGRWSPAERKAYLNSKKGDHRTVSIDQKLAAVELPLCRIAQLDDLLVFRGSSNITFGNHLLDHLNAAQLNSNEVEEQLAGCQSFLEGAFGSNSIRVLAYPYGLPPADTRVRALVADHVDHALLVSGGWFESGACDPLSIPRRNVPAGMSERAFRALMKGWSRD